ncbi:MAG TPA: PAS domain S-box protein [Anaerolineales bacterium]|nr:PAS domain S-box protein [Anaerolineales bacterium]
MRRNKTKAEIQLELEQAQKRIAELEAANLRDSEERFSRVFEASPAQMALTDLSNGRYVEVNEAFLHTLGFAREEVLGKTALELNLFSVPTQRAELLQRMGQQGYLRDEYVQVQAKSGDLRHGVFSAEFIQIQGKKYLLTVMNDITEWRRAEDRWQFAVEGAGDGLWDWNAQTNRVFYSTQWKKMLGYEENEIGDTLEEWASRVHPDDYAPTMEKVNAHLTGETPVYISEHRILCKDGTYKWILDRGKTIEWTEERKPLRVIGTHKDITERKSMVEKLRQSEERFARVFHANPAVQLVVSMENGKIIDVNKAFCLQTGYLQDELLGQPISKFAFWKDPLQQQNMIQQLQAGGHVYGIETDFRTRTGEVRTLLLSFEPIELNRSPYIISSGVDISERKQAESALRNSERQYHSLIESLDVSLCRWLPDSTLTFANEKYKKLFGVQGEAVGQKWLTFLPAETRTATAIFYADVAKNPRTVIYEHPVTLEDGSIREFQWIDTPIFDEQGKVLEFQSVGLDVHEQKLDKKVIQENETRLQGILEATPDAMVIIGTDGKVLMANAQTEKTFGYSREELLGMYVENLMPTSLRSLHIGNRDQYLAHPRTVTTGVERDIFALRKNGETFPAEISLSYHKQASGESIVLCAIRDVTEQKRVRELIAAQRDLARLNGASLPPEQVWGACLQVALGVSGLDCGGIYLLNEHAHAYELVHYVGIGPKFAAQIFQLQEGSSRAQLFLTGQPFYFSEAELCLQPETVQEGVQSVGVLPLQYQTKIVGCLAIASHSLSNISDSARIALETVAVEIGNILVHQQTEEALQTSRKQLSQTLIAARMGTWRWHIPTNHMEWSPEAAYIFGVGFTQNDFSEVLERFHPEDRPRLVQSIQEAFTQRRILQLEYRIFDVNGKIIWVTNYGHIEYDADGKPLIVTGLLQDITERKLAENALIANEKKLKSLVESQSHFMIRVNMDGRYTYWNAQFEKEFGWLFEAQSIQNAFVFTSVCEYHHQRMIDIVAECMAFPGKVFSVEIDKPARGGGVRNTLWEFICLTDEHNQPIEVQCMGIDITERKQAEEARREIDERYQLLFELMNQGVIFQDNQGYLLHANPAAERILGLNLNEIKGQHFIGAKWPMIHEDGSPLSADSHPAIIALKTGQAVYNTVMGIFNPHQERQMWLNVNAVPRFMDGETQPYQVFSTFEDITERKQAEEELRLAEQRYRALIENAPDGIILVGLDGNFTYASPTAEKLTGYSQTELQHLDPVAMTHPTDIPMVLEELDKVLQNPTYTPIIQYRYQNKQNEWRWVESTYSNLMALPSVAAIIINFRDITERKLAEEALKRSQELLKEAQRIGQIGYMEWNRHTQELSCSDEIYDIFDVSPDTPISKELIDSMMKPGERERLKTLDRQAIQQRMDMNYEYTILTRHGQERWLHQIGKTTYNEEGAPIRMMMIVQNITERKQTEIALRASEEKYRGLMESLDSIVATIDADGTFLYMNDLAASSLGMPAAQLTGKNMGNLFPPEYAEQQLASIRQVIREDTPYIFESQSVLQGKLRWYRTSIQPIHDEGGRVTHVLLNTTDIDNLKTIQHELETLNRTLEEKVNQRTAEVQDLYDHAPVGYYSLNTNGGITAINQTALHWLGYSREELLGSLVTSMFVTEDPKIFIQDFEQFKITRTPRNLELVARRKDGSTFPVMLNAIAIYDENGQYVSSRSTLTDITQLKLAENELKRNVNFTNALLDAIPTPVFYKDRHGKYQGCNHAFTDIMGRTAEQIQGKSVYELWPSENAKIYHQKDLELMERGVQQVYESTVHDKDGLERPVIFVKDIFYDEGGKVAGLVGAFIDITERKRAEDALRLANTEMERAMRMKDEFLANMSHELRTPLNAVLGLSESLIEQLIGPLNERQLYSLQTIEQSGRHLLELINDILDLSKLESNQMSLELAPLDVGEMCEASLIFIKEMARKKYLQVTFKPDPAVGVIQADGRRLKQMLVNLLSNAVKFTPEGGAIELQITGNPARKTISISVTDTGIGIATENLPRLFQPFVQLDSGLNRQFEGTGLGLALVASMAKLHGGHVSVQSEPGQGSRFTILLPWVEPDPSPFSEAALPPKPVLPPAPLPPLGSGSLILIAEDNEANVVTLSMYLQATGYRVAIARNGVEALNHARFKRPALILMDLQMPVLDGLEATRRLRQDHDPQIAQIPVIALTAFAMPADRERALEAGADEYLSKPVNMKQLSEMITRLVKEK